MTLNRKLLKISLLQCLPDDSLLLIAIYKSSQHCQCQECHKIFVKKEVIFSKVAEKFESLKKKIS